MNEDRFEQLLDEMRNEAAPAAEQQAAQARVWNRLQRPACAEFTSELSGYVAGQLLESRRLLVEDHVRRCAHCRGDVAKLRGETPAKIVALPPRPALAAWSRWAVAAGVALATAWAGRDWIDSAMAPSGPRATVETASGRVVSLTGESLAPGSKLDEGVIVRTGAGARASLRLRDGSLVELNERSQLYLRAAWSGQRIHLERGDAIVQAAKQRRGRLQLITRDATSSVKGTVFAVSTGVAGSLVSVVEGAVEVEHGNSSASETLRAGQQIATSKALQASGVRDAVAWSPNAEKYYALLAEFSKLEEQIAALATPNLRTQSRLLGRLLPDTWLYGAVPNADGSLQRALDLVERRARESEIFGDWWKGAGGMKPVLEQMQTISGMLGDEVVFMLAPDPAKRTDAIPLILAEVKAGREDALKQALNKIVAGANNAYKVSGNLLLISEDAARLARAEAALGRGATSVFAQELARKYQRGAGWLLAVDAGVLLASGPGPQERAVLNAIGVGQVRHAFIEQRGIGGRDDNEASIGFQGTRRGVASWLATPGALAAADYISPQAIAAGAATVRNPRQAFDELIAALGSALPGFTADLRKFETDTGVNVAGDLASAFGTDLALSIETATPPMPGWVLAAEVYSPASLDATAKRLVEAYNKQALTVQNQKPHKLELKEETVSGRKWMSLTESAGQQALYWTYDRGYLVATMDRGLGARAIATRAAGTPLVRSAAFRERTPVSPGAHNSGFVWLHTRGALETLLSATGNQSPALKSLLSSRNPVLIMVNGETERIAAFSRTRLTSLLLDLMMVAPGERTAPGGGKTAQKQLHGTGD